MRTNLLKRVPLFFSFLLITALSLLLSCVEPEPIIPDCEKYGYGDVTIRNSTGYSLWVDCTYIIGGVNYEKKLYSGNSYTYEMDKGTVYIWASFDGDDWVYDSQYLSACEDLTYTWYLNKKKSTGTGLYLEISKDGKVVERITSFTNFKRNL